MPTEQNPPKVFISYSHDTPEHRLRVYDLLRKLRADGVLCITDHLIMSPPEGWRAWMQDQIKEAHFTLVVCTETYCRRAERKELPGVGLGATWEAALITDEIYRNAARNEKFIPVVFDKEDVAHIPPQLGQVSYYRVDLDDGYELLLRHLTNQPLFEEPPVAAKVRSLPPINRQKDSNEGEKKVGGSLLQKVVQPSDSKIEAKTKEENSTLVMPTEKPNTTQSNAVIPSSVTLEMKHARVENTVLSQINSGKIEKIPVEFYRVAAYGEHKDRNNFTEDLGNGVKLEMIAIPGGSFQMGSNDFFDTQPIHRVKLSPFHIGKYQVTQAQWQAVIGNNPSHFKGDKLPVEQVSWAMGAEFCEKLSKQTGKNYRPPTEAEWEYACRAGSTTRYCFGDDEASLDEYAWHKKNSGGKTHSVGEKKPNAWGLHDIHGNVLEWCQDCYEENYYHYSPEKDPQGPKKETQRVDLWWDDEYRLFRGGSWGLIGNCCSASRFKGQADFTSHCVGVRVVCVARTS